ncbi:MAG: hypothetical protein GY871_04645 [Actinomycetales bacterium]|nr:hypothetical protein [Actinomycetales bacterium]
MNARRQPPPFPQNLREAARDFRPNAFTNRLLGRIRRSLGARPPRVAASQMGPRTDLRRTTARPSDEAQAKARSRANAWANAWQDPWLQGRLERLADYREMAEEVPELPKSIEVIIDFVKGASDPDAWKPKLDHARPEVARIAEDAYKRMGLYDIVFGQLSEGMWLGDSFERAVYGARTEGLVAEQHFIPEQVSIRVDQVSKQLSHYEIRVDYEREPLLLAPFEVIHYAYRPRLGNLYGLAQWHAARNVRRQHEAVVSTGTLVTVRRASGEIYWLWPFPANMQDDLIDEFIGHAQEHTQFGWLFDSDGNLRKQAAQHVDMDPRFVPYRYVPGNTEAPDPKAIQVPPTDVRGMVPFAQYLQDRFFVATGVPKALVGLERDVNSRATVEQQALHFALTLADRQKDARDLFIDWMTRACMAAGVVPEDGEIDVFVPTISSLDEMLRATVSRERALAVFNLAQSGVPVRFAVQQGLGLNDEDVEHINLVVDGENPSLAWGNAAAAAEFEAAEAERPGIAQP